MYRHMRTNHDEIRGGGGRGPLALGYDAVMDSIRSGWLDRQRAVFWEHAPDPGVDVRRLGNRN